MMSLARAVMAALLVLPGVLSAAALAASAAANPAGAIEPPQVLYRDLFVEVQMQRVFDDSKVFADAEARGTPKQILADYHQQRPSGPVALKSFVEAHFKLTPDATSPTSAPGQVPILRHIDGLWDPLTRNTLETSPASSLLSLPHPYVVPGGRFHEVYYWDSYFTMLGLEQGGRHDLVEDMVRDFGYLIDTYAHVPNGTRSYYLSRSQPPFFYLMVALFSGHDAAAGDARYLTQLRREYAFWMDGEAGLAPGKARRRVVAMPDGSVLNRYWDDRDSPRDESYREDVELGRNSGRPERQLYRDIRAAAESGWDFSSRWFADGQSRATIQTTQIVPVDLNSLLYGLENAIRAGCKRRADKTCASEFERRAKARAAAIDRYLWNGDAGAYYDYNWQNDAAIKRLSAATLYPLFVGVASAQEADAVGKLAARDLLKPGGIVATLLSTGEQWDAPNGWAPLQWIAVDGLRRYGQNLLAERIACRWMFNVQNVYRQSGKLVEKYDVMSTGKSGGGGEYPTQDGFGWTNGVFDAMSGLYPTDLGATSVESCH